MKIELGRRVELGSRVRDRITGLEGIAISRTEFLYGCVRIGVQSVKLHEGKPVDSVWIDEPQLEILEEGVVTPKNKKPKHGLRPSPTRAKDATR